MNTDQWSTTINQFFTAVLAALALLGWVDAATGTQLATLLSQLFTEILAVVTTLGTVISIVVAIWRRTHPAQAQAAARSIVTNPTPDTVGPVIEALSAVGAKVDTSSLQLKKG